VDDKPEAAPEDAPAPKRAGAVLGGVVAGVPHGLLTVALWGLCVLIIGLVVWGAALLAGRLSIVVLPLFAAFLLTAALKPLDDFLVRHRWPGWAAALACLLFLVVVVGGLLSLVGVQIGLQWTELSTQTVAGFKELVGWLGRGPLHINQAQIDTWIRGLTDFLTNQQTAVASMAAAVGSSIVRFLTGLLLCLFAIFFLLKDGRRFSTALHALVPASMRSVVSEAAGAGWLSMVSYVRAAVIVAACDGIGAGLGAIILGSQLWVAIMALTFVFAFVPMLGALVAGGVGCIIILATLGWVKALIMLAVFVVVLETEVHVMQPLLLGRAVDIHPLVVLVSIAIGMALAGVPGGVFAIPLVALIVGVVRAATGQTAANPVDSPRGMRRRISWRKARR